jgi:glycosyltransferase involved in cell wall biosynthesis
MPVTLVTHVRNRNHIVPAANSEVIYIDTEWFAGPLYATAKRLFPKSEHSVFLLSSLDYFVYERTAIRALNARRTEWDVVHAVTPVSPSARTSFADLGLPVVRGPLNGGLTTPPNFPEFMKADSAWLYSLRDLPKLFQRRTNAARTLVANDATQRAVGKRVATLRMPEIAVDPTVYAASPWPDPPSATRPLRVLFAGRLIPAKALPLLMEAGRLVSLRHPIEITVVGDGPMRVEWEAAAAMKGVAARFTGALDIVGIARELERAHVFCLPSIRESGGAVLLEAMSAARPVVAVNYGGPAEIVNDRVGTLVPADSPTAVIHGIESALLRVIANPCDARRQGEEGRRYILAQHTWDRRIEAGLDLYRELAGKQQLKRIA